MMKDISKEKKYYLIGEDCDIIEVLPCFSPDGEFYCFCDVEGNDYNNIFSDQEGIYRSEDDDEVRIYSKDYLIDLYSSLDDLLYPVDYDVPRLPAFPSNEKDLNMIKRFGDTHTITPMPIGNGRVALVNLRKNQSVVYGDGKRYIYILTKKGEATK